MIRQPEPDTEPIMADTAGHDVHFESADAGASLTYPQQAGTVRKNGFLVIKGRPCKVSLLGICSIAVGLSSGSVNQKHGWQRCCYDCLLRLIGLCMCISYHLQASQPNG